jgi:hypothetical protein
MTVRISPKSSYSFGNHFEQNFLIIIAIIVGTWHGKDNYGKQIISCT